MEREKLEEFQRLCKNLLGVLRKYNKGVESKIEIDGEVIYIRMSKKEW